MANREKIMDLSACVSLLAICSFLSVGFVCFLAVMFPWTIKFVAKEISELFSQLDWGVLCPEVTSWSVCLTA